VVVGHPHPDASNEYCTARTSSTSARSRHIVRNRTGVQAECLGDRRQHVVALRVGQVAGADLGVQVHPLNTCAEYRTPPMISGIC